MRYFSFKILILCILLPPILYLVSIGWIENRMGVKYSNDIASIYTGDSKRLFDGSISLKDAINDNIDNYLSTRNVLFRDVNVNVTVVTKQGMILYPSLFENENTSMFTPDPLRIAAENYKMLDDGLVVKITATLDRNTRLSYILFTFYSIISIGILYIFYSIGVRKEKHEADLVNLEIKQLTEKEIKNTNKLNTLAQERGKLENDLAEMKNKLSEASKSEDGMIEEIVTLEEKIEQNIALQNSQQEEINELKQRIDQYKFGKKKGGRQKAKGHDAVSKRFKALYKTIRVEDRAVDGYLELEEDMRLKCEEVIYQLNDNPDLVTVKRKVFGRKGRETVLEVIFGYKGRLYYRKNKDGKPEVLAVGTKNTQSRELEYLDKL